MSGSVLDGKKILAVDDEPDILTVLKDEIRDACPKCTIDTATTYEEAAKRLDSAHYDVVILDIMGVRGFDLLEIAVKKGLKVAMLTAHALSPEALKRSRDLGARAYLPKEKIHEIVSFLEDVLTYDFEAGWTHLFERLDKFYDEIFESDWRKKVGITSRGFY